MSTVYSELRRYLSNAPSCADFSVSGAAASESGAISCAPAARQKAPAAKQAMIFFINSGIRVNNRMTRNGPVRGMQRRFDPRIAFRPETRDAMRPASRPTADKGTPIPPHSPFGHAGGIPEKGIECERRRNLGAPERAADRGDAPGRTNTLRTKRPPAGDRDPGSRRRIRPATARRTRAMRTLCYRSNQPGVV